jgi:predicted enzyme related to lactoylglutathione lyase
MDYTFVFTDRRDAVARFYRDVVGLPQESVGADSNWFGAENASFVVHEREDRETAPEVASGHGFVVWFRVVDVRAAYERAQAAGAIIGDYYDGKPYPYFFARDPDGRYVGVGSLARPDARDPGRP